MICFGFVSLVLFNENKEYSQRLLLKTEFKEQYIATSGVCFRATKWKCLTVNNNVGQVVHVQNTNILQELCRRFGVYQIQFNVFH